MKNKICEWGKAHKKGLIIGGCAVVVVITGGFILYKYPEIGESVHTFTETFGNKTARQSADRSTRKLAEHATDLETLNISHRTLSFANTLPFPVREHVRRLPEGQRASENALTFAKELGISLEQDETVVRPYMKGM